MKSSRLFIGWREKIAHKCQVRDVHTIIKKWVPALFVNIIIIYMELDDE